MGKSTPVLPARPDPAASRGAGVQQRPPRRQEECRQHPAQRAKQRAGPAHSQRAGPVGDVRQGGRAARPEVSHAAAGATEAGGALLRGLRTSSDWRRARRWGAHQAAHAGRGGQEDAGHAAGEVVSRPESPTTQQRQVDGARQNRRQSARRRACGQRGGGGCGPVGPSLSLAEQHHERKRAHARRPADVSHAPSARSHRRQAC